MKFHFIIHLDWFSNYHNLRTFAMQYDLFVELLQHIDCLSNELYHCVHHHQQGHQ